MYSHRRRCSGVEMFSVLFVRQKHHQQRTRTGREELLEREDDRKRDEI